MEPQTVLALISTLAQTARSLTPEVEKAFQILTSNDADHVRAALAELQAAGDALHAQVHAKLGQAALKL